MTDQIRTPCGESDTPDDWFISRDGKQYPSDDLLSDDERDRANKAARDELERDGGIFGEVLERHLDRAEADARTAALQRRRHAKEACYEACAFRLNCLTAALDNGETQGTWGGYYEEEIKELHTEIERRERARELAGLGGPNGPEEQQRPAQESSTEPAGEGSGAHASEGDPARPGQA